MTTRSPLPNSYWVVPGRLLAGEYPYAPSHAEGRRKVKVLLEAGIDFVIDLTEEGERGLLAYDPAMQEEAAALGRAVTRVRFPVRDLGVPSEATARMMVESLSDALAAGRTVYVHCFGGKGRTGTLVALHLMEQGMDADEAIDRITGLRRETRDSWVECPEMPGQVVFVRRWKRTGA